MLRTFSYRHDYGTNYTAGVRDMETGAEYTVLDGRGLMGARVVTCCHCRPDREAGERCEHEKHLQRTRAHGQFCRTWCRACGQERQVNQHKLCDPCNSIHGPTPPGT